MRKIYLIAFLLTFNCYAETFNDLINLLEQHDLVRSELNKAKSILEKARKAGSWGDPRLSISAMNFPQDSLSRDESMMTGIMVGLSQKISVTGKYGKLRESGEENSKSKLAQTKQLKREFAKFIWAFGIEKEKLVKEHRILKENLAWIRSNLKVTKKLYSTGKVPQQAVLDIQIRQSELRAQIDRNSYDQDSIKYQLTALLSSKKKLDIQIETVPWNHLRNWDSAKEDNDYKKKSLKHRLRASDLRVTAQNRNLFPDITLGVSYTKRNDIDGIGDFVGASITIPIPTSSSRYADRKSAIFEKVAAEKKFKNYLISKDSQLNKMKNDIKDIDNQLTILQKETLKFAKSSRDVTAKSYSRGGADYLELLRSELQYQNQLLKEVNLIANLKNKKLNYLFLQGDDLKIGRIQ